MPKYWVGGNGNSNDSAHWAASSGGAGGTGVPTSSDDVVFDDLSASDNYTVTFDTGFRCKNFYMDKPAGAGKKVTWSWDSSAKNLYVFGSINLIGGTAGITLQQFGLTIIMSATSGTHTVDLNGIVPYAFLMNGVGGTFQLANNVEVKAYHGTSGYVFARINGNFIANGFAVIITSTSSNSFGLYGDFTGSNAFYDLTRNMDTDPSIRTVRTDLYNNIEITHNLVIAGGSAIARIKMMSNVAGTSRTITAANVSCSNVDFQDIIGAGAGNWDLSAISGGSGDCGGNSGITFTPPATQYWHKASGATNNWSTAGNWYLGTGGSGGAGRVPLPQDLAIFDDLSFGSAGMTIVQDMPRIPTVTFAGIDGLHPVANNPTFTTSTAASVFGSLTLVAGLTLTNSTQAYTFEGRAAGMPAGGWTLTSAGHQWNKSLYVSAVGGTYKLLDGLDCTGTVTHTAGAFDANGKNVICYAWKTLSPGVGLSLNIDNATLELTGYGQAFWHAIGYSTFSALNSIIKFTNTSANAITTAFGAWTYGKVWFSRGASTGDITIGTTHCGFAEFKDDGSSAHNLIWTAGRNYTFTAFNVNGTAGKLITIKSTSTTPVTFIKAGGGYASIHFVSVDYIVGSPINTWYAGDNSVDGGHNSNVYFTPPPAFPVGISKTLAYAVLLRTDISKTARYCIVFNVEKTLTMTYALSLPETMTRGQFLKFIRNSKINNYQIGISNKKRHPKNIP